MTGGEFVRTEKVSTYSVTNQNPGLAPSAKPLRHEGRLAVHGDGLRAVPEVQPAVRATENPLVSIIIPTHNYASYLPRAIDSCLNQSYRAIEIIVVDDGSTDETETVVSQMGGIVRYLRQSNAGASAARNHGVREARSPWIAFLDSDDYWLDPHLEHIAHALSATSGKANCYFTDIKLAEERGGDSLWAKSGFGISGEFELAADGTDWVLREWHPMMLQSSVFSRAAFLDCGGLLESIRSREDTHLFLKLGIGGPVCAVAGCTTVQTYGDGPHLIAEVGSQSESFWINTVILHEDIRSRFPHLPARYRRIVGRRLSEAHWRLCRFAMKRGSYAAVVREGVKSFTAKL